MSGSAIALILLLSLSMAVAAFCHSTIRSFMGASTASALISTVLFQGAIYHNLGYLDPFFPIALVTGAFFGFLISIPVGLVARAIHARRQLPK
ncbi:MAG: hypothetical protein ABMA13_12905 [Chthoniobacteraceae bacterium]